MGFLIDAVATWVGLAGYPQKGCAGGLIFMSSQNLAELITTCADDDL
jgi:hypothetical protein